MGTFYRSRHELIFAFKHGTAPHLNTFELGQHGRYRTNVWQYRGVNTLRPGRMEELALHPTVKPVQLIADAIRDVSGRGRDRARCVRRLWLDPDRGREDWPEGPAVRTRPRLLRPYPRPLGNLCEGRRRAADRHAAGWRPLPGAAAMSTSNRRPGRPRHYDVGYGKPPKKHRFRKGQSGNPRGRPKGARSGSSVPSEGSLLDLMRKEARRTITVRDGHGDLTLRMKEDHHPHPVYRCRQGQASSPTAPYRDAQQGQSERTGSYESALLNEAIAYKRDWKLELEYRKRFGITRCSNAHAASRSYQD